MSSSNSESCPKNSAVVSGADSDAGPHGAEEIYAGKHLIADFWAPRYLTDAVKIETALKDAAAAAGAKLLSVHVHRFSGAGGVTGVALLAESHISVHTWPEHDYAAFDIFMCSSADPGLALDVLRTVFLPEREDVRELIRGCMAPIPADN